MADQPILPPLTKEPVRRLSGWTTSLWKHPAFRTLYKTCVGFAVAALMDQMTWKAAGIAALVAVLSSSHDILWNDNPVTEAKS